MTSRAAVCGILAVWLMVSNLPAKAYESTDEDAHESSLGLQSKQRRDHAGSYDPDESSSQSDQLHAEDALLHILSSVQDDSNGHRPQLLKEDHISIHDSHSLYNTATSLLRLRDLLLGRQDIGNTIDRKGSETGREVDDFEQALSENDWNSLPGEVKSAIARRVVSDLDVTEKGNNPFSTWKSGLLDLLNRDYHETHCSDIGQMCGWYLSPCCNNRGQNRLKVATCCRTDLYTAHSDWKGKWGYCIPNTTGRRCPK